jgi:hypothetical protein
MRIQRSGGVPGKSAPNAGRRDGLRPADIVPDHFFEDVILNVFSKDTSGAPIPKLTEPGLKKIRRAVIGTQSQLPRGWGSKRRRGK